MDDLDRAVRAVVRDCLGVKDGEEVLVVCNPVTEDLGERLRDEAADDGAEAVLAVISERDSHAAEPPRTVAEAMAAADVRAGADDPVALPHRRPQARQRERAYASRRCRA